MDISLGKKITFILVSLAIISCSTIKESSTPTVNFKSITGTGILIEKFPDDNSENQLGQARVLLLDNITIRQEPNCKGLSLATQTKTIVVVGDCPSGQYFVCPDGPDSCSVKGLYQTKRNNNVYQYESDFAGLNYVVELYFDKIIYRIQESHCMVPYPHGCLVKAPGWKDVERFEFIKH